jgi:hypothetical protein
MSGEENRRSQSKDFAMATEAHQSGLEIETRRRTSLRFRGPDRGDAACFRMA